MKRKILGVLSVVMLSGAILLGGQSMETEAANGYNWKQPSHTCNFVTRASTHFPQADNFRHLREYRVMTDCYYCGALDYYRVDRYYEKHSCPGNSQCVCGFKPPVY